MKSRIKIKSRMLCTRPIRVLLFLLLLLLILFQILLFILLLLFACLPLVNPSIED